MERASQWIYTLTRLDADDQARIAATLFVLFGLWLLHAALLSTIFRKTQDVRVRYTGKKWTTTAVSLLAIFLVARIWLGGFQSVLTVLGLVSAALTIVLRDVLVNWAGWFYIVLRKPFGISDRVQIHTAAGDVIDVGMQHFALMEVGEQSTGRVLQVPNGWLFVHALANYTKAFPYIWNEMRVTLSLDSDWHAAKQILQDIIARRVPMVGEQVERSVVEASHEYMIHSGILSPAVYTSVQGDLVHLTMRYLCDPRGRRDSEQTIWEDVLDAFKGRDDIRMVGSLQRQANPAANQPGASIY